MILFFLAIREWKCEHNKMIEYMKSIPAQELKRAGKLKETATTRSPMNVHFDFRLIENVTKDTLACKRVGQLIRWSGEYFTCTSADIVTPEKLLAVKETLTNVHNYLREIINVTKYDNFEVYSGREHYVEEGTDSGDADLYLTVYARPFGGPGSSTLASAGSYHLHTDDNLEHRPQNGIVHINFANVPNISSNIDDQPRRFFEVCVHETVHALGFSSDFYSTWVNRTSKSVYAVVNRSVTSPKYPKKVFNIFVTPKLVELFTNKFGTNSFAAGVEIEDGGGPGTAGSHFEMRTYYTELMCGQTIGYSFISEFTLGLLFDTGWYDVDFSKAEPFYYGNYKAVIGDIQPYTNFPFGPPDKYFPSRYISNVSKETCSYDHYFGGIFSPAKYYCSIGTNKQCCEYYSFTDSNNKLICDPRNELQDYVPFISPYSNRFCKNPSSFIDPSNDFNFEFGGNSFCADVKSYYSDTFPGCYNMKCSKTNELSIIHKNSTYSCPKAGDKIVISTSYSIICPDPKIICGMINYKLNNAISESPPKPTSSPRPARTPVNPIPAPPAATKTKERVIPIPEPPAAPVTNQPDVPKTQQPAAPVTKQPCVPCTCKPNDYPEGQVNGGRDKSNIAILGGSISAVVVIAIIIIVMVIVCRDRCCKKEDTSDFEVVGELTVI